MKSPLALLLAVLTITAFSGLVLPLDPFGMELGRAWEGPSAVHPCGRDGLGRDLLARLLVGSGTSFGLAAMSLGLALTLGVTLGGLAGWCGGLVDALVMRVVDLLMGIRELVLAIVIAVLIGPSGSAIILILGVGYAAPLIRFVRSLILEQRGRAHILAAVALGAPPLHVVRRHILPNIAGPVAVRSAAVIGPLIQAEATLSFLGIGVQDPAPSLGTLMRDGLTGLRSGPHLILITTAMIFLVVLAATLMADAVRDSRDPRTLA